MKWPSGLILKPVIAGLVLGALSLGAQTSDENTASNNTTTTATAEVSAAVATETSSADVTTTVASPAATAAPAPTETATVTTDAAPAQTTAEASATTESPAKESAATPATTDSGAQPPATAAEAAPAKAADEAQPITANTGGTPAVAASVSEPATATSAKETTPAAPTAEGAPAKTDSDTQPAAAVTEAAPTAEKTVPAKTTEAAVTNKPENFDLDRSVPAAANVKAGSKPAETAATEAPPKKSFWSWFRSGKKPAAEPKVEAGAQTQAVSAATGAANVPVAEGFKTPEEKLAAQEEVRRQAQEVAGLKTLDQAYQAMGRNEFDDALKLFSQAMGSLPSRPQTIEVRNKARDSQAECEYRLALNYYKAGNLTEAKNALRRSLSYNPAFSKSNRLNERIKNEESRKVAMAAKPVPPRQEPDYLNREKRIQAAITRGQQYMAIKEYEKAKYEFRNVLIEDSKNEVAGANLKKIAEEEYSLDSKQMDRQQKEMMDQVRDTWTPAVKQEIVGPTVTVGPAEPVDKMRATVLEKLNRIIIPEMVFRQANIVDAVNFLNEQSIVGDKESAPSDRGVNIILNLRRPGATGAEPAAPAVPADETAGTSAEGEVTQGAARGVPTITVNLRNVTLLDAIKIITDVTTLKYRIEGNAVMITPVDVVVGAIETRTYKVQSTISEIVFSGTSAGGAEGGGALSTELGGSTITTQAGDVKKFFVDAGVPFPEGTSLVYKPSLNMLIVSNTRENLEKFESILSKLNVVPAQIEIEARFIEVNQEDLEELGVEWLLTDNWEIAENKSSSAIPSARERVQVDKNSFTKGLRYAQGFGDYASNGQLGSLLSISSILTNPELKFVLHALEQQSHGNLLSAPKVTTKTGANAEIKIVREIIYPTDFEVTPPTSQGSAGSQSQVSPGFVTPQSFEKRDTGVILNVTPNVEPDGFTINLTMLPQVVELADWINYGTWMPDGKGGLQQMNIPQPIFNSRTIATTISIWDGQTVVMGGLIAEIQETIEDKIPFLGDIPLLGYLFKSKATSSIKRNLLIFVTANLVDPAGNKINKPGTEALATTKTTPGVSAAAGGTTATP